MTLIAFGIVSDQYIMFLQKEVEKYPFFGKALESLKLRWE